MTLSRLRLLALILVGVHLVTSGCLLLIEPRSLLGVVEPPKTMPQKGMDEGLEEGLRALVKELPAAFDAAKIQTLALVDVVGVDGRISVLDRLVLERTTAALTQMGRYRVVERERIDKVRAEIKFSLSDVIDPKTAIEAGKLMGADALLTGTSFDQDDEIEFMLRIIASRTGQVVWSAPLRVAKDRRARALFAREVGREARGSRPPLRLGMFVIARRDRETRIVQDRDVLQSGGLFQIHFETNADSYFYVVLVEHTGGVQVLFPNREASDSNKVQGGRMRALPSKDYWYYLDNRAGTETIYGLASYEPLDLKTLVAQLESGAAGAEAPAPESLGPEASISQEIIIHQRSAALAQRGSAPPPPHNGGVLYRGQSPFLQRGAAGIVQGPIAKIELPDAQKIEAQTQLVQGYTSAVISVTYAHQ